MGVQALARGGGKCSRAAHWIDHVLPVVGVRQWVLTLPRKLRLTLARHHAVVLALLRIAADEISAWLQRPRRSQPAEGGLPQPR